VIAHIFYGFAKYRVLNLYKFFSNSFIANVLNFMFNIIEVMEIVQIAIYGKPLRYEVTSILLQIATLSHNVARILSLHLPGSFLHEQNGRLVCAS